MMIPQLSPLLGNKRKISSLSGSLVDGGNKCAFDVDRDVLLLVMVLYDCPVKVYKYMYM